MKYLSTRTTATVTMATAVLIASAIAFVAEAALTDISTVPLASSSSVVVKPNLLLTMDTSGSMGWAAETADEDSSQALSSGAKAASIIATHADRARSPDMKWGAPKLLKLIRLRATPVLDNSARLMRSK